MIHINCDLGEGVGNESELFPHIDACNIAAGGHAGDEQSVRQCIQLALKYQVEIGIHPSYPDRENFGRVSMKLSQKELIKTIREQIDSFLKIAADENATVNHIKAHGALYNDCVQNEELASTFLEAVQPYMNGKVLYASYGSKIAMLAENQGLQVVYEFFADRAYTEEGRLLSRKNDKALIIDPNEVIKRIDEFAQTGLLTTVEGRKIYQKANTFCVHSDSPAALELITQIKMQCKNPIQNFPKFLQYGERSILVQWPEVMSQNILGEIRRFTEELRTEEPAEIVEIVPSMNSVTLIFQQAVKVDEWASYLSAIGIASQKQVLPKSRLWKIPVCYDPIFGLDIEFLAKELKISVAELIALHTNQTYTVHSFGFLPGFLYLGGLDSRLVIPRRGSPRLSIPKGSVGIGGEQTGIYPTESPGGWQLIGRTPIKMFNVQEYLGAFNPIFSRMGDQIQFIPISCDEFSELELKVSQDSFEMESEVINA